MANYRVRAIKIVRLLRHPDAWRSVQTGLRAGVFPSFEHDRVPFGFDFATVIDAGAARGQFALFALWRFPAAQVICFEPLPDEAGVAINVLPTDRATVYEVALGAARGKATLHVSAQSDSSSLLPIGSGQVAAFPGTEEVRQLIVPMDTLEPYLSEVHAKRPCLLKIDVQGFELEVLRGTGGALDRVDEVLVETSFVELYPGQPRVEEVIAFLAARGLRLVDISGLARAPTGEAVQADFLFRRTRLPTREPTIAADGFDPVALRAPAPPQSLTGGLDGWAESTQPE